MTQRLRLATQLTFLALNVWIGVRFVQWADGAAIARPTGIEGWLPIAGLMNLKAFLVTHHVPVVHAASMFILIAFLAISLLLKKSFCSWLCPIGTISEVLWKYGRVFLRKSVALPKWLDLPLRAIKYALLAFFVFAIVRMSAGEIAAFMSSPYGMTADVRLLDFFRHLSNTAFVILLALAVLSVFIQNFWCRYLCPYGALLGIVALASPARIRRDTEKCIDCAKCTKACPMRLPVATKPQIRSAECTLCLECVAVCPKAGALGVRMGVTR